MDGDARELDALYRRYAPIAYRRARHLLGSEDDAHELVHDVFASLLERPQQFSGRSHMTTFMYSVVTHACLNRLRNQRKRQRLLHATPAVGSQRPLAAPPEVSAALRSALSRMPEELAVVSLYYHAEGHTHDDIARILGCSPRHVGNLLQRATAFLERAEDIA